MKRTYRLMYRLGLRPWQSADIPAPVRALVAGPDGLPGGLAVDLGCGTGEQARFLAANGWQVTAVDFVPQAIAAARRQDPGGAVSWLCADVSRLHLLDDGSLPLGAAMLVLDNGCLHGLGDTDRSGWARTVNSLVAPGATVLVRAARPRRGGLVGPVGIDRPEIEELLGGAWTSSAAPSGEEPVGWYRYLRATSLETAQTA